MKTWRSGDCSARRAVARVAMAVLALAFASTPGESSTLFSVDFQGTGSPITMSGVEPVYGFGNFWNDFRLSHVPGTSNTASANITDSTGIGFPTAFLLVERLVSGFNGTGSDPLNTDYLVFNNGIADPSITWDFGGLVAGVTYEMFVYGGDLPGFGFTMTIDTDGDGSLLDETPQLVDSSHRLFTGITATNIGCSPETAARGACIRGQAQGLLTEGHWSGFQLQEQRPAAVPVPSSFLLLVAGVVALAVRRRRIARTSRK